MSASAQAGYPPPAINADGAPFWQAAAEGRLVLKSCKACGKPHYPPRYLCPHCWSEKLEWIKSEVMGTVYSLTVTRRAPFEAFAQRVPYMVALVDIDERARLMTNIVGDGALQAKIGDRVRVCFEKRGEHAVPQFELVR